MMPRRHDPTLLRLRRRLDRWELRHLRSLAADLAERLEAAERQRDDADAQADFWREQVHNLHHDLDEDGGGRRVGMTVNGQMRVVISQ